MSSQLAYLSIESSSVKAVLSLVCEICVISFKNGVLLGWLGSINYTQKNYLLYLIHFGVILQHTYVATFPSLHIIMDLTIASKKNVSRVTSRLDELKSIFLLCVIFIMCKLDFCFIKPCQCLYHLEDNSIIFSGKITCNVKICKEKNVKLTNRRHPYFSHFGCMVWGAGKFVVKTARVYRVK